MIAGCWVLGGVFDRCNGRTPRDLVTVANTFGIDNIILECGWFNEYKPYLREFVTVMADNGISVELLLADYSWSLAPKHSEALSAMEDVIEFVNEINDGSVVLRENTSACVSISERRTPPLWPVRTRTTGDHGTTGTAPGWREKTQEIAATSEEAYWGRKMS
jgi:hypothetical protein